jgi:hypothetical protein
MQLDQIKEWLETLPKWARPVVEVGAIVVVSALVTLIVCLVGGWTDLTSISNGLFLASAVVFLAGMLIYFGSRAGGGVRDAKDENQPKKEETPMEVLRRRRRPGSRYTTIVIVAGFVIFGLSVAVGSFV